MAISFVNTSVASNVGATTVQPTIPTTQVGDLVIIMASLSRSGAGFVVPVGTGYPGWTIVEDESTLTDGSLFSRVIYKIATSTSETSPTFESVISGNTIATCLVYRGVDQTTPFIAEAGVDHSAASSTSHPAPAISNTDAAAWGVFLGAVRQVASPITWTPGTGLTERSDAESGAANTNNCSQIGADTNGVITTGSKTYSSTTSTASANATLWAAILKPAGAGTTPVEDTNSDTYAVRAIVTDTSSDTWDVRAVITDASSETYAVRSAVTDAVSEAYAVRAVITDTVSEAYAVRAPVSNARAETFAVRTSVTSSRTDTFDVSVPSITWQGETWNVVVGTSGPGPNVFGGGVENVEVLPGGELRLSVANVGGTWKSGFVKRAAGGLGYGRYRWVYDYDVANMDPQTNVSLFVYESDTLEIDIETSKWGDPAATSHQLYTVQPGGPANPPKDHAHPLSTVGPFTAEFVWEAGRTYFKTTDANGLVLGEHVVTQDVPTPGALVPMMNHWLYQGGPPPSNGLPIDVVIHSFVFTAGVTTTQPKAEFFSEDFSDQYGWNRGSGVSITGGELVIPLTSNYVAATVESGSVLDIRNSYSQIEISQWHNRASGGAPEVYWFLYYDDTHALLMFANGLNLWGRRWPEDGPGVGFLATIDPVAHKFWRMEVSGTTVSWRTSPDGVTWTTLGTPSATSMTTQQLSTLRHLIQAGHDGSAVSPGTVKITQVGPPGVTPVEASRTDTFSVRAVITDAASETYDVRLVVTDAVSEAYAVRTSVSDSRAETFTVRAPVSAARADAYDVRAFVTDVNTDTYAVRTAVANAVADTFAIRTAVVDTVSEVWAVKEAVASAVSDTYAVRSVITDTVSEAYDVRAVITDTGSDTWSVKAIITDTSTDAWDVRAVTTNTASETWGVRTSVTDTSSDTYAVRALVTDTVSDQYDVAALSGLSTISTTRSDTWSVRAAVTNTASETWGVRTSVTDTSSDTYAVLASAAQSRAETYAVRVAVTAARTDTYPVRAPAENARTDTYIVRAGVTASSADTWSVFSPVAQSRSDTWSLRALAAASRTEAWNVLALAIGTTFDQWEVISLAPPIIAGPDETFVVRADPRVAVIDPESRVWAVPVDDRTMRVPVRQLVASGGF